jgi:hypothetical protein
MARRLTQKVADHPTAAEQARRQPGTWVRLGTYTHPESARHAAYTVRNALVAAYAPAGAFQTWRALGDGLRTVWVRYVDGLSPLSADPPEALTEPVRLALDMADRRQRYVSAFEVAARLDDRGFTAEAAAVRSLAVSHRKAGAVQAAAHLYQLNTRKGCNA